jgi:hypothetical protein
MDMRAKNQTTTQSLLEHKVYFAITLKSERITGSFVKEMRKILSQGRLKQFYEQKWQKDYQTIMWDPFLKQSKVKNQGE